MSRKLLAVAGWTNLAIAAFQVGLAFFGTAAARYFFAPRWALRMMAAGAAPMILLVGTAASLSVLVGAYGLSGARLVRPLPALRPVILIFGSLYALWGTRVAELAWLAWQYPGRIPLRLFFIRSVPLLLGLAYLAGARALRAPSVRAER